MITAAEAAYRVNPVERARPFATVDEVWAVAMQRR
jgi:hypothetical protein